MITSLDTETNGLRDYNHTIQIGAILYDGKEKQEFDQMMDWKKIDPEFDIPEETIRVHGIHQSDLDDKPKPQEAYGTFCDKILENLAEGKNLVFNGWNVTFDMHMMITDVYDLLTKFNNTPEEKEKLSRLLGIFYRSFKPAIIDENMKVNVESEDQIFVIDSMRLDMKYHKLDKNGIKIAHSLANAAERYNVVNKGAHDAFNDTDATFQIFMKQYKEFGIKSVSELQKIAEDTYYETNHGKNYFGFIM